MDKLKANPDTDIVQQFASIMARLIVLHDIHSSSDLTLAIAVSGGADSFALLHLTHQWARVQSSPVTIIALTVDHHLRSDSTQEAQHVAAWCQAHNIEHHILDWVGDKPTTAIQDTARNMRRNLLEQFCASRGIVHLLLGHQADDQAETFLMRLQRGSGVTGLSAMHSRTDADVNGLVVVRPVLSMRRADLRHYCTVHTIPFIDDPSNENTDYERIRIRQTLTQMPPEIATNITDGIAYATTRLQRADRALHDITHAWMAKHVQEISTDTFWLPLDTFIRNPTEIRIRILTLVSSLISGNTRPSLSTIEEWETRITDSGFTGVNMAGCWARPKIINTVQGVLFQTEPPRKQ